MDNRIEYTQADIEAGARHLALKHAKANDVAGDYSWETTDDVWRRSFIKQSVDFFEAVGAERKRIVRAA